MTVPQHSTPAPPGWYPDPSGSGQLQWWDGSAWTGSAWTPGQQGSGQQGSGQQVPGQQGAAQGWPGQQVPGQGWPAQQGQYVRPMPPAPRPEISRQTPVYNPFIWLVTLLPLISLAILMVWNPVFHVRYSGGRRVPVLDPSSFTVPYFLLITIGWLIYGVTVFLSYLDWQKLQRDGVVRPFHWAWAFLGAGVYVVGRSIIVHKVAKDRGLVPVWVLIGVTGLTFILVGIKFGIIVSGLARTLTM
ncbi:DUF2510 domain-containing protein [Arthrobacter sp. NyZ413]|uniref:DUF2510 domain-containing protein n=1 Tax=Arthrobacter sp. NyZ413 TaxID=3144669 RepID=UPI003BF77C69